MKFSICKFCDVEISSACLSMDERDSLLSNLKVPGGIAGARFIETDEEVASLPNDSLIDLRSHGVEAKRTCKLAPSVASVWLVGIASVSITLKG